MIRQDYVLLGAAMALLALNWLGAAFTIRRLRTRGDGAANRTGHPHSNVSPGWPNITLTTSGMGIATVIVMTMIAIGMAFVIVK
jgi:hypothetical protein